MRGCRIAVSRRSSCVRRIEAAQRGYTRYRAGRRKWCWGGLRCGTWLNFGRAGKAYADPCILARENDDWLDLSSFGTGFLDANKGLALRHRAAEVEQRAIALIKRFGFCFNFSLNRNFCDGCL